LLQHAQIDSGTALFYVVNGSNVLLLFIDAMQFISNMCLSYSVLYLLCKLPSNI